MLGISRERVEHPTAFWTGSLYGKYAAVALADVVSEIDGILLTLADVLQTLVALVGVVIYVVSVPIYHVILLARMVSTERS